MSNLCEIYTFSEGFKFSKQYKECYKKQRQSFERDFENIKKTLLANLETTRNTERIPLGQELGCYGVYKTRIMITNLRDWCGRVIWHPNKTKKEILLIDVYLKSNKHQNHDINLIKDSLNNYYSSQN